jgi:anti-sigma factor RsiW
MTAKLSCQRAEELFSDHAEGTLEPRLRADLVAHLQSCTECGPLFADFQEVVAALREHPTLEPSADLARRSADAALQLPRPRRVGPSVSLAWPAGLRIAAAVALLLSGAGLLWKGDAGLARPATRLWERATNAAVFLEERKDRWVEDVRILRVVIAAAFEGRLDRVNDRFDDYRRLIEKRRATAQPKKTGKNQSNSARADLVTRSEDSKERCHS